MSNLKLRAVRELPGEYELAGPASLLEPGDLLAGQAVASVKPAEHAGKPAVSVVLADARYAFGLLREPSYAGSLASVGRMTFAQDAEVTFRRLTGEDAADPDYDPAAVDFQSDPGVTLRTDELEPGDELGFSYASAGTWDPEEGDGPAEDKTVKAVTPTGLVVFADDEAYQSRPHLLWRVQRRRNPNHAVRVEVDLAVSDESRLQRDYGVGVERVQAGVALTGSRAAVQNALVKGLGLDHADAQELVERVDHAPTRAAVV